MRRRERAREVPELGTCGFAAGERGAPERLLHLEGVIPKIKSGGRAIQTFLSPFEFGQF